MRRLVLAVLCVSAAAAALGGAPREFDVQGAYEGTWKAGAEEGTLEAMVVAQGNNTFKVHLTQLFKEEGKKPAKVMLDGKTEGDAVAFKGGGWSGAYADGAIAGKGAANATFQLKRVIKKSPTFGAKPPEGAVVLFDGKNLDQWVGRRNQPPRWKILPDGTAQVQGGTITTKQRFGGNFKYHVEFKTAFRPDKRSQGRGNSGVFLPNGEEIQVLDSYGNDTYKGGGCGGLYRYKDPDVFAHFPPGTWQTFDIEHVEQKPDAKGKKKVRVTVLQNGVKIHDNVQLRRDARQGNLRLQDHGNPVQYRNIWLLPLKDK